MVFFLYLSEARLDQGRATKQKLLLTDFSLPPFPLSSFLLCLGAEALLENSFTVPGRCGGFLGLPSLPEMGWGRDLFVSGWRMKGNRCWMTSVVPDTTVVLRKLAFHITVATPMLCV